MYPIIIDANVWVRFARAKDIAPLIDRLVAYNFFPVVNNYLLSEIFNALVDNKWMAKKQATHVIDFIKRIAIVEIERAVYRISPDPKDNYLFDLGIQQNCVFIISDDTVLLHFKLKPIPVHSTSWFLRKFPIR